MGEKYILFLVLSYDWALSSWRFHGQGEVDVSIKHGHLSGRKLAVLKHTYLWERIWMTTQYLESTLGFGEVFQHPLPPNTSNLREDFFKNASQVSMKFIKAKTKTQLSYRWVGYCEQFLVDFQLCRCGKGSCYWLTKTFSASEYPVSCLLWASFLIVYGPRFKCQRLSYINCLNGKICTVDTHLCRKWGFIVM